MALGVLRAMHEGGRSIPGEISIVGFDDVPEAPYFTPPLTTIRQDFDDYAPFVRPGGLIALHDIRADPRGWSGEVHRVWPELAARFDGEELVDESGAAGYGIGLLRWPGEPGGNELD